MAETEVVFVNDLAASGFVNGVINMALVTYQFVPEYQPGNGDNQEGKMVVALSPKITANLRFDLRLAQVLRDRLDGIIKENTKPRATN